MPRDAVSRTANVERTLKPLRDDSALSYIQKITSLARSNLPHCRDVYLNILQHIYIEYYYMEYVHILFGYVTQPQCFFIFCACKKMNDKTRT